MSRCQRCDACESMWDNKNCEYCNFPGTDTRTEENKAIDRAAYLERMESMGCDENGVYIEEA